MVASVDVELEGYELLEQVDNLRQRAKVQAAIIGLLVRVLRFRRGKLDGVAFPMGRPNRRCSGRSRRRLVSCR